MAEKLSFYDVKAKKKFTSNKYSIVKKSGRTFATVKSPLTGVKSFRIVAKKK